MLIDNKLNCLSQFEILKFNVMAFVSTFNIIEKFQMSYLHRDISSVSTWDFPFLFE